MEQCGRSAVRRALQQQLFGGSLPWHGTHEPHMHTAEVIVGLYTSISVSHVMLTMLKCFMLLPNWMQPQLDANRDVSNTHTSAG